MNTITTFTGKDVDPFNLRPEDVDIVDIAHSLAMTVRFNGHCHEFFCVAQHSIHVSRKCPPEFALEGLLHDAAEAYLGDVTTPSKRRLSGYKVAEDAAHAVIASRFGLAPSISPIVKQADHEQFEIEKPFLLHGVGPAPFECLEWRSAKEAFLARFYALGGEV